jgi:predicted 3-demethylubiquinone-9 3-methyltransferase (glyoxalase superfamily)
VIKKTGFEKERSPLKFTPFLMFSGQAEEAMKFYTSLLKDSKINNINRYDKNGPEPEGTVQLAKFTLHDQEFLCIDSFIQHDFSFTPAFSIFVDFDNEEELVQVFQEFSNGGKILMDLDNHGFSKKFAWVEDKFGVSWQLNLP